MQKSLIRGTVLALCVAGIPAFAAVYKEAGGRVVIEAEHFDARTTNTTDNHVWQIVPDENGNPNTPVDAGFANARGGKYMQTQPDVLGGNLAVHNTVATVGIDPHLDFKVQIGTPGDYRLWLRWGGYDGSSDSVYAQILELQTPTGPGPDWYRYVGQALVAAVQDFNTGWNGVAAPSTDLANRVGGGGGEVPALWWIGTPGVYTIRLSMREDGSAVDALILQLSSLSDPDNPGPAESTIVGAADTSGPTIIDAWTGGNPNGAFVRFSEDVSPSTATNKSNYTINNGVVVNSASFYGNNFTVLLNTTVLTPGQAYQVTVTGVQDTAAPPNTISATNSPFIINPSLGAIQRRAFYVAGGNIAAITNSTIFLNDQPSEVTFPALFEGPVNYRDGYGTQIRGYFFAPVTGDYVFYVASDDPSALYLSTDATPAQKHLIASEAGWSNSRSYATAGGGASNAGDKRSDQFAASEWPTPNQITLTAGRSYYIEQLHAEGGGGDNVSTAVQLPGQPEVANGATPISGKYLTPFAGVTPAAVAITNSPANLTTNELQQASFKVGYTGSQPLFIQWYRNGVPIRGANAATYIIPEVAPTDNGVQFKAIVNNGFSTATSAAATLTVISDVTDPTLVRVTGSSSMDRVVLSFSEGVAPATAGQITNYTITGLTISNVVVGTGPFKTNVVLITSRHTPGTSYPITVRNVTDRSSLAHVISPNPTTATLQSFVLTRGFALREWFGTDFLGNSIGGTTVANLTNAPVYPNFPQLSIYTNIFELNAGDNQIPPARPDAGIGDNYGARISALFIPPETGSYVFFHASDDNGGLWLSTDELPANKHQIAAETVWSARRTWVTSNGNSDITAKRSDQYVLTSEWPTPNQINLTLGNRYYIEALMKEGGGGDNLAIAVVLPSVGGEPVTGDVNAIIPGAYLGVYADPVGTGVTITQNLQNQTNFTFRSVTFTIVATATSGGQPSAIAYQWQRNGVDIPGATGPSYTTPALTIADNGARYRVLMNAPGLATPTASAEAVLTVIADTTAPSVLGAGTVSFDYVGVKFDEAVDPTTAQDATKYTVSGATVSSAVTNYDGASVTLAMTGLTNGPFTVKVNGVTDLAGNAVNNITVNGHIESGLINQDVDTASVGSATSPADGEFYITAGGTDMWGNGDQFHFVGTQVAGDFDKKVKVESLEPVNRWSKAGLCVRENLDNVAAGGTIVGGAKNLDLYVMPLAVPVENVDAGNPIGQNGIEGGFRGTPDMGTGGWPTTAAGAQINPSYLPNAWVRLKGVGRTNYNSYYSTNGTDWILHSSALMNPPLTNQYVGIMLTAHNNTAGFEADAHFLNYGDVASAPRFSPVVLATGGSFTLQWTGTGTLQQTDSLSPPNWQPAPILTNPQTVTPAATGTRFYRVRSP